MKQHLISHDSTTFALALMGMRSNPSNGMSSHKISRSTEQGFYQKCSESSIYSPRISVTKRRDTTLKQLFSEYQAKPEIQFVLRLKQQASVNNACRPFDLWVSNLRQENRSSVEECMNFKKLNVLEQQSKVKSREQLKRQISENLLKMRSRLQQKQTLATQQSIKLDNITQNRQVKYSFSDYFSQCSQIQPKDRTKPQIATTISIGSDKIVSCFSQNKKQWQGLQSEESNIYLGRSKNLNNQNKQNIQLKANQGASKIVGLEFSKNKRFKSTKKKRRICP